MPKIIVKDHKYYFKIRGLGGPKGDKGDTGPAGPQGPQGPYVNVVAGTTTTLPAGSSAQVTVNNTGNTSTLNFGIPQGTKGDKGDAGTPGAQGPRGFAATVNVGETTTGQPGTNASVVNAGNEHDAVLKFTIPRGDKGETGETGPQGPTGGVKSTVVAELPETGESDKYYLVYRDSDGGTITTTDGCAQIENGENGGDLTLDKLYGNAEQTTYSGKNLVQINDISQTNQNVNYYSDISMQHRPTLVAGTTYTFSADITIGGSETECTVSIGAGQKAYAADVSSANNQTSGKLVMTFTPTTAQLANGANFFLRFPRFSSAKTGIDYSIKNAMLEVGSTATAYEKFVGGIPAPNPEFPQPISTVTGAQTVMVTGKNLFNFQEFAQDKIQAGGVIRGAATATGDSITITATENDAYTRVDFAHGYPPTIRVKNNTDYVLSWKTDNTSGTNMGVVYVFARGSNNQNIVIGYRQDTAGNFQFNTGAYSEITFRFGVASSGNSLTYSDIQFEEGNQASGYKPYDGTQSYEVNLGKNLIDINSLATANITVSNGVATGQAQNFYAAYGQSTDGVPFIKKSGQLAISFKAYTDGNESTADTNGLVVQVVYTDGTSALVIYCKNNETTAVQHTAMTASGKDVANIKLTYANCSSNIWHISEFQIEAGFPTTYAPYKTPIELCKIGTYQDRIYKDDGKWYIEKQIGKVVLDGTENWTLGTMFYCTDALSGKTAVTPATGGAIMSDYFTYSGGATNDPSIDIVNGNVLRIRDTSKADASAFTTWLGAHPTTVYYALAAPTTTEITDETLLYQLNFLASLYKGENNISLVGAGAQGEFTGDYVVYDKYNRHKVYIWSSDDNTWQIILQ